jgi:hypothetical protein
VTFSDTQDGHQVQGLPSDELKIEIENLLQNQWMK